MKKIAIALLALASLGLAGCDEETHPPKEIKESMMKQRQAMSPDRNSQGAPPQAGAPGR